MTSGMAGRWSVQGLGSWWPVAWQASGKRLASAWQAGGKRPVFLASARFTILGGGKSVRVFNGSGFGNPGQVFFV